MDVLKKHWNWEMSLMKKPYRELEVLKTLTIRRQYEYVPKWNRLKSIQNKAKSIQI